MRKLSESGDIYFLSFFKINQNLHSSSISEGQTNFLIRSFQEKDQLPFWQVLGLLDEKLLGKKIRPQLKFNVFLVEFGWKKNMKKFLEICNAMLLLGHAVLLSDAAKLHLLHFSVVNQNQ